MSDLYNVKQNMEYKQPIQVALVSGAITIKSGIVTITKAGVAVMTLAAPIAGKDDGKRLVIDSQTAQAHTVTITAGLRGAGSGADVLTWGGAIGDGIELYAYNGYWFPVPGTTVNVTAG